MSAPDRDAYSVSIHSAIAAYHVLMAISLECDTLDTSDVFEQAMDSAARHLRDEAPDDGEETEEAHPDDEEIQQIVRHLLEEIRDTLESISDHIEAARTLIRDGCFSDPGLYLEALVLPTEDIYSALSLISASRELSGPLERGDTTANLAILMQRRKERASVFRDLAARIYTDAQGRLHACNLQADLSPVTARAATPTVCDPDHAPDFSWVKSKGTTYPIRANQRPVLVALWNDWGRGGIGLSESYLMDQAGNPHGNMKDLFKDAAAWGKLIGKGDCKDTFRLAFDAPPST